MFRNIIHVLRVPPLRTFFPHFLGLTMGFVAVLVAVVHLPFSVVQSLLLLAIFGTGSWLGMLFVVTVTIVAFSGLSAWSDLHLQVMAQLYLNAYMAGWIFGVAYNGLVFLFLVRWGRRGLRLSFAYDRNNTFNIIKSPPIPNNPVPPIPAGNGEAQPEPNFHIRRLYDFDPPDPFPLHPYTIAFVANPMINGQRDPILDDLNLFLHTVDRALQSFERDQVLGAAEIWSRVRVVTFFDPNWAQPLVQPQNLQFQFGGQPRILDRFLVTLPGMAQFLFNRLQQQGHIPPVGQILPPGQIPPPIPRCQFDVIFVLSAWQEASCRSTALFSDYLDPGEAPTCAVPPAPPAGNFDFGDIMLPADRYASIPGRVALSIFSARTKTFIHEFAHAMSSSINGAIADEYYDPFQVPPLAAVAPGPVCINRLQRPAGDFVVPMNFDPFGGANIFSDLAHPSAEENWRSYFPERVEPGIPCTMDRSAGPYRFDRLISRFMYDRLGVKVDR